ncbi:MAG: recombinase family protein [Lysobacteraceae bacterium]|jgi:DNA invertase Pin-like site-specific DNA recombinase|nr:recombinase family protein [Silanimonas sp.]
MKRVALYLRVSTDGQTTEHQRRELEEVAQRAGWQVVEVYADEGVSGAKGRDKRPAFDRLLKDATRRRFEVVAAWSVDRLGRSMRDLLDFLQELQAAGVDLFLHKQALDTSTPAGRALFQMCGVFAEFERAMIQDRVRSGLATAKAKGVRLGRPKASPELEARIAELLAQGMGQRAIVKALGCGSSTVKRVADFAAKS